MKKKFYSTLSYQRMTKTSFASLVNRGVTNINGLASTAWKDDESFMALWDNMLECLLVYELPIMQVRASEETALLADAKKNRYWAYLGLRRSVSVFAVSEIEEERICSKRLNNLFRVKKLKDQTNKENRTTFLKLLGAKLQSPEYLADIMLLKVNGKVDRLVASNAVFVAQEMETSMKKKQSTEMNATDARNALTGSYQLALNYVQSLEAIGKVPFAELFTALDEARSYFARDTQYHKTLKDNKKLLNIKTATDSTLTSNSVAE